MSKWADYLVSAKRSNMAGGVRRISHLRVHPDNDTTIGTGEIWTKENVVRLLEAGYSFTTIYYNADDKLWKKGSAIRVYYAGTDKYLRTDANNIEEDNIGSLPEC